MSLLNPNSRIGRYRDSLKFFMPIKYLESLHVPQGTKTPIGRPLPSRVAHIGLALSSHQLPVLRGSSWTPLSTPHLSMTHPTTSPSLSPDMPLALCALATQVLLCHGHTRLILPIPTFYMTDKTWLSNVTSQGGFPGSVHMGNHSQVGLTHYILHQDKF